MQNTGAGMHSAVSEFVDGVNDGFGVVRWPAGDKGGSKDACNIIAVVTVFGFATFTAAE